MGDRTKLAGSKQLLKDICISTAVQSIGLDGTSPRLPPRRMMTKRKRKRKNQRRRLGIGEVVRFLLD